MTKMLLFGWACVGSHGKVYVTESSPHGACIGRFEIYQTKADALRNSAPGQDPVKIQVSIAGSQCRCTESDARLCALMAAEFLYPDTPACGCSCHGAPGNDFKGKV